MLTKRKRISEKRTSQITKASIKRVSYQQAQSEDDLQRQIVAKFRAHGAFVILTDAVGPALKFIPNQQKRMGFISWSKARGWSKGVPDLLIVWKGSILFLELKFGKQGRLSEEQKLWRQSVINAGYEYACWRTLQDCETWIAAHLVSSNTSSELTDL